MAVSIDAATDWGGVAAVELEEGDGRVELTADIDEAGGIKARSGRVGATRLRRRRRGPSRALQRRSEGTLGRDGRSRRGQHQGAGHRQTRGVRALAPPQRGSAE